MRAEKNGTSVGPGIMVEEVLLDPPAAGWNPVRVRIRNLTGSKQTCVVNVDQTGGFWFRDRARVFYREIPPLACEVLEAGYYCSSSAQGKVCVSVSVLSGTYTAEQSREGEPVGPSGARFVHLKQGPLELYAQRGTYAEANAEDVLARRSAAIAEICSFLGAPPRPMTLVLYGKAEEKTFDTGHLGAGLARGTLAVELFNEDCQLEPYHETVHVQAGVLGNPPAVLSEGLAVYLEEELGGSALRMFGSHETIDQAGRALVADFWPLETLLAFTEIGSGKTRPGVAYPQAASLVKHLVATYGKHKFLRAYKELVNGNTTETIDRNKRLLKEIFGMTLPEIEREWLETLKI